MKYVAMFLLTLVLVGCFDYVEDGYCCCMTTDSDVGVKYSKTTHATCKKNGGSCSSGSVSVTQCGHGNDSSSVLPKKFNIELRNVSFATVSDETKPILATEQSCYELCLHDATSDMAALHCYYADIADSTHSNYPKEAVDRILLAQNDNFKEDLMSIAGVEEDPCGFQIEHTKNRLFAQGNKCYFNTDISSGVTVDLDSGINAQVKKESNSIMYYNIDGVTMKYTDKALERSLGGKLNEISLSKKILTIKSKSCLIIYL
ncbi:hypothetical protein [Vibrio alginolyticus]|uniref:hypothetical protein n=1 Tax=Vibrio alginolyticus TaxID=663 RepID=UPI003D7EC245